MKLTSTTRPGRYRGCPSSSAQGRKAIRNHPTISSSASVSASGSPATSYTSLSRATVSVIHRHDVDLDCNRLVAAAESNSLHRRDIRVIASPSERDVVRRWHHVIGRIEVKPIEARTIDCQPGVGCIGAYGVLASAQITTHITRRQPERAHARDHYMSEILTDTEARAECLFNGGRNGGRLAIIL